jgi:general L-amino acid transport system permease protein
MPDQKQEIQTLPPPLMRSGVLRWLRENLFSTWYNTLLTVLCVFVLSGLLSSLFDWAIGRAVWDGGAKACESARRTAIEENRAVGACWTVIPANLKPLMAWTYPTEESWRIWTVIYLGVMLIGLSGGVWGGLIRESAIAIGCAGLLLLLLPFAWDERLWIAGVSLGTIGGLTLGWFTHSVRFWRGALIISWVLLPFIVALLLSGFVLPQFHLTQTFTLWVFALLLALALAVLVYWRRASSLKKSRRSGFPLVTAQIVFVTLALLSWVILPEAPIAGSTGSVLWALKPVATSEWGGLMLTFMLAIVGIVASFPLGVLLALGRQSSFPAIRWFCIAYIEVVRGVPLITVIFMASLMLPLFLPGTRPDQALRAMTAFTLFTAAYIAENVRGGLQAIPRGQYEAARALGLNTALTTIFIVLPQALRAVIPANVGQFISLFKDTSLVFVASLIDLFNAGRSILANPNWLGQGTEMLLFVALVYWIFTYFMSHLSRRLEKALGVGER